MQNKDFSYSIIIKLILIVKENIYHIILNLECMKLMLLVYNTHILQLIKQKRNFSLKKNQNLKLHKNHYHFTDVYYERNSKMLALFYLLYTLLEESSDKCHIFCKI